MALVSAAVTWLSCGFGERIASTVAVEDKVTAAAPTAGETRVERVDEPAVEWASGAVASARHTAVASRILARIEAVHVRAGDNVAAGDTFATLDARGYESRQRQVNEALAGAQVQRELARVEKDRAESLVQRGSGTRQRFDEAISRLRIAQAEVHRLEQGVAEAETELSYTAIRSPVAGRVIDRLAEPGDTVTPGQVLPRI